MSVQQFVDCDTVNYACDSGLTAMDSISPKRMPCARRSVLERLEERLQGLECNMEITQEVSRENKDMSTDSEKALKSAAAQQPVPIIKAEQKRLLRFEDLCRTTWRPNKGK